MRRWLSHARTAYESFTDGDLIAATRDGDIHAFGELWVRYEQVATAVARRLSPRTADDLVAEAFTSILRCLRGGKGPSDNFRAYLVAALRSKHVDQWRRERQCTSVAEIETIDELSSRRERFEPDELDEAELARALDAWNTLDERQQWLIRATAIEGRSTSELAAELDARPGTVAVWVHRARERLRAAYLTHVVPAAEDPECQPFRDRFPRYLRGSLTARQQTEMENHLDECAHCGRALAAATEVNSRIRVAVGPLLPVLGLKLAPGVGLASPWGRIRSIAHALGTKTAVAAAAVGAVVAIPLTTHHHGQPVSHPRAPQVATEYDAAPAPRTLKPVATTPKRATPVPQPSRYAALPRVVIATPRPTASPSSPPPEPVLPTAPPASPSPGVAPTPSTTMALAQPTLSSGTANFTIITPDAADTSGTIVVDLPEGWTFTAIRLTGMTGGSMSTLYTGTNSVTLTLSHVSTDPTTAALQLRVSGTGPAMTSPQAQTTATLNGTAPVISTQPLA